MKAQKIIWKRKEETYLPSPIPIEEWNGFIGTKFYIGTVRIFTKHVLLLPAIKFIKRKQCLKCKSFNEAKIKAQKIVNKFWESITEEG